MVDPGVQGPPASDDRMRRLDERHQPVRALPQREAFLLARMRDDLLGPLEEVIAQAEMLLRDARELDRPAAYLEDVARMAAAASQLYQFVERKLRDVDLRHEDFAEELRRVRHDIGNQLNHVSGFCQILMLSESEEHFGRFAPDLSRILAACGSCTSRLLKYRRLDGESSADGAAVDGAPEGTTESVDGAEPGPGASNGAVGARPETEPPATAEDLPPDSVPAAGPVVVPAARTVDPGRILVVEDSERSRDILTRLLERDGHAVGTAVDGCEALEIVEREDFDLVLLDVFMPRMNGFEVLARLKADERFRHIPVIIVSGLDETENAIRAIGAGAEDFLTKPVNQVLLKVRVESCLDKLRHREREFGQFFTPDLARHLARRPELLTRGRDAHVSVLFCDIRGFSRLSERLEPAATVTWLSHVMDALTDCVMEHRGTIVDYIGDELMAMWGAPEEMPDHATLAVRAARDMLARLPELNRRWESVVGGPMDLGIGINSGVARVGNTGSARKFKYGPLGNTVNLASRVQGATKHTRTRILATGATAAELGDEFPRRRLCRVRVVNIEEPIELVEIFPKDDVDRSRLIVPYEEALSQFDAARFRAAASTLGALLAEFPDDGPSLLLLSRSVNQLVDESKALDLVWRLPGK